MRDIAVIDNLELVGRPPELVGITNWLPLSLLGGMSPNASHPTSSYMAAVASFWGALFFFVLRDSISAQLAPTEQKR